MSTFPTPEQAFIRHRDLFPPIMAGLDYGVVDARSYFQERGIPFGTDPWLFSDIVRHGVRRHLRNHGHLPAELQDLANGGLQIEFGDSVVRLRRSHRGGLRVAGSPTEEAFYAQNLGLVPEAYSAHLYLLWDATRNTYELLPQLHLACPRESDMRYPNVAECHWFERVPEEMLYFPVAAPLADAEDADDLDITLPADDEAAAR